MNGDDLSKYYSLYTESFWKVREIMECITYGGFFTSFIV